MLDGLGVMARGRARVVVVVRKRVRERMIWRFVRGSIVGELGQKGYY